MNNPKRIDRILNKIGVLWKQTPSERLGQLLENYVFIGGKRGDRTSCALFFQEDDTTENILTTLVDMKNEK